jgi:hypothetical protein
LQYDKKEVVSAVATIVAGLALGLSVARLRNISPVFYWQAEYR